MLPSQFHFIQRGWLNSNSILLLGDGGPVIVDTGYITCVEETLALIRQAGVAPEALQLIVTTHGHCDHHGANAALKKVSHAPIAMSEATALLFARNDRRRLWLSYLGQEARLVTADLIYHDGDHITLAGMPFEVIATPGHAPDAISLYQPDTRVLICADALWENDCGILNMVVHGRAALETAVATVQRLMTYDVAVAIPGHGRLIADVTQNLEAVARRLARFRREPSQLAWHFVRRVTMFNVLRFQPLNRETLAQNTLAWPWLHDYAPACGYTDAAPLLDFILDDFLERELLQIQNGLLTSVLPC